MKTERASGRHAHLREEVAAEHAEHRRVQLRQREVQLLHYDHVQNKMSQYKHEEEEKRKNKNQISQLVLDAQ